MTSSRFDVSEGGKRSDAVGEGGDEESIDGRVGFAALRSEESLSGKREKEVRWQRVPRASEPSCEPR